MFGMFTPKPTQTQIARIERRWLRSVIAASDEPLPAFPWMRAAKQSGAGGGIDDASAPHRPGHALFRREGLHREGPGGLAAR